jgi:hypothetical protein
MRSNGWGLSRSHPLPVLFPWLLADRLRLENLPQVLGISKAVPPALAFEVTSSQYRHVTVAAPRIMKMMCFIELAPCRSVLNGRAFGLRV